MILDWYWLLSIAVVHYIADFFIQTHKQSLGKSTDIDLLTDHIFTYTISFAPLFITFVTIYHNGNVALGLFFAMSAITFITHWITDYFTSRVAKIFFDRKEVRQGFQILGIKLLICIKPIGE
jgi:hypothetical protein